MRRYAQTALLVLLGGMLIKLVATGAHLRYVRGGFAPLLVLAGVGLLAVAAVNLWRDLRADAVSRDDDTIATGLRLDGLFGSERQRAERATAERTTAEPAEAGGTADHRDRALAAGRAAAAHEGLDESTGQVARAAESELARMYAPTAAFDVVHAGGFRTAGGAGSVGAPASSGEPAGPSAEPTPASVGDRPVRPGTGEGWLLLVAALAALVLAPPALGSFPAIHAGAPSAHGPAGPVPDGDPVSMSLADYAAHAAAGGQALAGQPVRLVGFVLAGPRGEPYLARLAVGCCAAGARPVKVGLTGDLPSVLTADRWVEVVGVYTDQVGRDPVNAAPIPFLSVVSVTEIEAPADPYES